MAAPSPSPARPEQLELFSFAPDMRVEQVEGNRVRITPAGPPRRWVRLSEAADRIAPGTDSRTVLRLGQAGHFSVRRVGGLWQVDLLGLENYLTDCVAR